MSLSLSRVLCTTSLHPLQFLGAVKLASAASYDLPDGSIMYAEVRIGDSAVMGDAGENWPAVLAHLHVYIDDIDATFRRALNAGGIPVQAPERKGDDPDRRRVRDPASNTCDSDAGRLTGSA